MTPRCPDCNERLRSGLRSAARRAQAATARQQWAADTRALAGRILAELPADPDADQHRMSIQPPPRRDTAP